MSYRSTRSRRKVVEYPPHQDSALSLTHGTPAKSLSDRYCTPTEFLPIQVTAKMKIDVQLNVQIFRVRKIDNSTEEITLDLGITYANSNFLLISHFYLYFTYSADLCGTTHI